MLELCPTAETFDNHPTPLSNFPPSIPATSVPLPKQMKKSILLAISIAVLFLYYYFVNPSGGADETANVPILKCPLHLLTGLQCPLCGLQRSLHAIAHADFLQALRYNAFLILLLPLAALILFDNIRPTRLHTFLHSGRFAIALCLLATLWMVLRNILNS